MTGNGHAAEIGSRDQDPDLPKKISELDLNHLQDAVGLDHEIRQEEGKF